MSGRYAYRGRRGGGRLATGQRPVSESNRIDIAEQLAQFQASDESEFTFDSGLSNHDRAVVHVQCKKYGLTSKSYGKGNERAVKVFKHKGKQKHSKDIFDLSFQAESLAVLNDHFQEYPPSPAELQAAADGLANDPARLHTLSADFSTVALSPDGSPASSHAGSGRTPRKRKASGGSAATFSEQQVAQRWQAYQTKRQQPAVQKMGATTAALPIAAYRQQILEAVSSSQVVLISGETGCGKTTQVPQYILDQAWAEGKPCRLLCTQPRRISAVSVADRVASERGESLGDTVGYTIRLDSKGGLNSSLMFCTNGILLRMLTSGDGLQDVTHIVVDEIHERDKFADFLLITVRDLLPSRPQLRLVLMSATLNVELFQGYFDGCPLIKVPGYTYPVQDLYLEDILKLIGYNAPDDYIPDSIGNEDSSSTAKGALNRLQTATIEQAIMDAFLTGDEDSWDRLMELTGAQGGTHDTALVNVAHPSTGATALMAAAGKGRLHELSMLLAAGAAPEMQSKAGTARDWALRFGHAEAAEILQQHEEAAVEADVAAGGAIALSHYQANTDADEVDIDLMVTLLKYICGESPYSRGEEGGLILGAVLVFLPGWDEIIRLKEQLEKLPCFRGRGYSLLPLHSMVAPQEQRRVFVRPPTGVRKIILATNIAETAVTIDDVVCVINSGRLKEKSYDPYTGVSTLQSAWVSQASEKQRRGRAGRCQAGIAFHCYSRTRSQAMAELQLPELKRSPLDELCLQVKLLEGGASGPTVAAFLGKAVEPPVYAAVKNALRLLEDIGAIQEHTEALTKLGRHLAALPLSPRIGKLLLYGVMFGCLDPILTVACCMAYRDPWVLPVESGARKASIQSRRSLAEGAGGSSDHLALVKAFNGWAAAKRAGQERSFCSSNFLSMSTMTMINGMRGQLLGELQYRGLVDSLPSASINAADGGLVRSVLACGFYPLVGRLLPQKHRHQAATVITAKEEKVRVHPSSINSSLKVPDTAPGAAEDCPVILFEELTRGESQLYMRQCTLASSHALSLVAAHFSLSQEPDEEEELVTTWYGDNGYEEKAPVSSSNNGLITIDGWLKLRVGLSYVAHLCCLRHRLATAFAAKVEGSQGLSGAQQSALQAIGQVFSLEAAADNFSSNLGTSQNDRHMPPGLMPRGRGRSRAPAGRGRSQGGQSLSPRTINVQTPYGRGQLHAAPQHGQTGWYGSDGREQQQPQLQSQQQHQPQQQHRQQQQHQSSNGRGGRRAQDSSGRGRAGFRGQGRARGRGRPV